ncbi:DivIVA domain-containing protein [Micromonospora coxensis]|uniref:DivIVA domain-containing protein n=1 Tax=Micromonospora coxensis TaxID=356852 RepID=A0A1C5J3M4_9ACTN|nr:DivIVA domain-containing protein [Micromonospora coxensis]SCG64861.1 DivIVA domain-containing protein [Micromonospora coxensis]
MGQVLLVLVVALTVAAVVFGVTVLVSGRDPGLVPAEPDGRAVPLPGARPLRESDVGEVRFDTALRGYRMAQVDQAMRRAAYDIGYKTELIGVLEAEVTALREGRTADADALRRAREEAAGAATDRPTDPAATDRPSAGTAPASAGHEPPAGDATPALRDAAAAPAPAEAAAATESDETAATGSDETAATGSDEAAATGSDAAAVARPEAADATRPGPADRRDADPADAAKVRSEPV